jgi:predicted lipoprotein with Yx(FWY)xxD motif
LALIVKNSGDPGIKSSQPVLVHGEVKLPLSSDANKETVMSFRTIILASASLALATTMAYADDYAMGAIKSMKTDQGEILTDAKGMTLYTFDKDTSGVSNCYDKCATNWPPLMATADAKADGDYSLVERKDGSMQWAYKGMPLYLWVKDAVPGDMTGDGVNKVWHVAKE